ncbi:hypothetical protein KIN20_006093 [Parelaphostrongylus tenuis]|uniref:Uncharacterized protein n=1 Tax=Parelaphostrongylus tenuis TaxID=148309 RepID=A0AAD5M156_PARTN|nr:hypothetical protein KIN20_006093 [Parelaphostrongylus tenuis]
MKLWFILPATNSAAGHYRVKQQENSEAGDSASSLFEASSGENCMQSSSEVQRFVAEGEALRNKESALQDEVRVRNLARQGRRVSPVSPVVPLIVE